MAENDGLETLPCPRCGDPTDNDDGAEVCFACELEAEAFALRVRAIGLHARHEAALDARRKRNGRSST